MGFLALSCYSIHCIAYLMCYPNHKLIYPAAATLDWMAGIKTIKQLFIKQLFFLAFQYFVLLGAATGLNGKLTYLNLMKRTAHSCGSCCWGEGYSLQNSLNRCCKLLQSNWCFYLNTSLGAICRIWYCCLHMGATGLCISDVCFCLASVLCVYSTYWFLWFFLLGL